MKRFLSLLALVAVPASGFAADNMSKKSDVNAAHKMKECCSNGPVSSMDETWADRTDLKVGFTKYSSPFYALNTIQPLYRDASMENTLFVQAGIGAYKWHRSTADIGLGYRYMTPCGNHMFGISAFYFDNTRTHNHHQRHLDLMKKTGLGGDLSWFTKYTTLSLGQYHGTHSNKIKHAWDDFFNKGTTTLDLKFIVPYLPWAEIGIGKEWRHHHNHNGRLDYNLSMNVAGPLAIEMGYRNGWSKHGYINFVVSFGRPAVREYTMVENFIGDEAFTPRRDLKDYTLDPVARARI